MPSLKQRCNSKRVHFLYTFRPLFWVLCISIFIGWELFEYILYRIVGSETMFALDTIHDVINDCLGALWAITWSRLHNRLQ